MAWVYLFVAGILEIIWATSMKMSMGFTRPLPSIVTGLAAFAGFWLLAAAMRSLPLGTAYAVWVGIGVLGTFVLGAALFGEELTPLRIGSAALIVLGIVGLRLSALSV